MDEADARIAKYLIDRGERDSALVVLLNEKVDTLNSIITTQSALLKSRDSTIQLYSWLENAYRRLEANWQANDSLCNRQLAAERKISDDLLRKLKGQRRKTIFVGIAAVGAGIVIHSFIKK